LTAASHLKPEVPRVVLLQSRSDDHFPVVGVGRASTKFTRKPGVLIDFVADGKLGRQKAVSVATVAGKRY
jgi:hypothetical protein